MLTLRKHQASILFADDDGVGRSALSTLLRSQGFEVWEAATGKEALRRVKDHPDLVLLDVRLPDASGLDLCRQIKADPATATAPVLLISGCFVNSRDRVSGLEGGADGYLTKPVEPDEVAAQIRALLRVRQAEDALRHSEARFRAIIEKSFEAVFLLAADGTVRYASPSSVRILGYSPEELVGRNGFELIHPDDRRGVEAAFAKELQKADATVTAVYRGRHRDGSWRWLEAAGTNLLDDPDVQAIVGNYHDITERRRLEEQLRQSQRQEAVGRLAAGVAHDFNNILTVITGFADMALYQLPPESDVCDLVTEIQNAAGRAVSLTRQLLAFGRKQMLQPKVLDLNALVTDLTRMLRRLLSEAIDLTLSLEPALGRVKADPGQLEQVVVNLAVNARDAMPHGGHLNIRTANVDLAGDNPDIRPGPYVMLAVKDSGCGMTAAVRDHIFEPFFTTKEVGKGTGLGLATVYGIIKQSGGHIEFDTQVGSGTTFRVYLPRVDEAVREEPTSSGMNWAPRGTETVLLVEDDESVRSLARQVLHGLGYSVLEAVDGAAALRLAERYAGEIHLLLTDVVMPVMGGRQLAERLAASRPATRVLFASGYTEDEVIRHGISAAKMNFIQKPYAPAALAQKVRAVLDGPKATAVS
jgi:PAS domain S-box-containing protein